MRRREVTKWEHFGTGHHSLPDCAGSVLAHLAAGGRKSGRAGVSLERPQEIPIRYGTCERARAAAVSF